MRKWSLEIEKQVSEYKQISDHVRRMVKSLCEEALLEAKYWKKKKSKRRNAHGDLKKSLNYKKQGWRLRENLRRNLRRTEAV